MKAHFYRFSILSMLLMISFLEGIAQNIAPKSTADYIIYIEESGAITAQSGITGEILGTSGNAADIIQKSIDTLPLNGGKIYISAGSYAIDKTIVIRNKHGVHIEGAARGMQGPAKGGTVLNAGEKPIDVLEIFGDDYRIFGITISNILIWGSGKDNGKAGILVRGTTDVLTLNSVGANHCGIGFYLKGGGGKGGSGVLDAPQIYFCDPQQNGIGLYIERCHYGKIVGGEVSDNTDYGIVLSGAEPGHHSVSGVKLMTITGVRNGKAGILVGKNTHDISIGGGSDIGGTSLGNGITISNEQGAGNIPENIIVSGIHSYNHSDAAIGIENGKHIIIQGNILSDHNHEVVDHNRQQFGIYIDKEVEDVNIVGNIMYGNKKDILNNSKYVLLESNNKKSE